METNRIRRVPEGARRATGGALAAHGGRLVVRHKAEAVQRLLRGEDKNLLARALRVAAESSTTWRYDFQRGPQTGPSTKEATDGRSDEVLWLQARTGELTRWTILLYEVFQVLEVQRSLACRRSKP